MKRRISWLLITGLTAAGAIAAMSNRQFLLAQIGIVPPGATPAELPGRPDQESQYRQLLALQAVQTYPSTYPQPGVAVAPSAAQPTVNPSFLLPTVGQSGPMATATTIANVYASPASHQDEQRIQGWLGAYQASKDEAKRQEAVVQITKAVTHQFEERQEVRQRELKQLEERLADLKEKHAKRESLKEKIVSDRVQQLINNVEGLGWGNEPSPWLGQNMPLGATIPPSISTYGGAARYTTPAASLPSGQYLPGSGTPAVAAPSAATNVNPLNKQSAGSPVLAPLTTQPDSSPLPLLNTPSLPAVDTLGGEDGGGQN